ncbi:MAG: transcription-repair coupling factor [Lachnospiraceae bacterium]|nr:transcription-repair coupling factor [Lachnospiraceae bacterium]
MKLFTSVLEELEEYKLALEKLREGKNVELTSLAPSQEFHMVYGLGGDFDVRLIVTYDNQRAQEIAEEYSFFDPNTVYFPAKDLIFYQADLYSNQITIQRIKALEAMTKGEKVTIVTTIDALLSPITPKEVLLDNVIEIDKGQILSEEAVSRKLVDMGYANVTRVENRGEFSIHGGIVDIYNITDDNPYRIELWGDEVDSIRMFDALSQRSIHGSDNIKKIRIVPAMEMIVDSDLLQKGLKKIKKEAQEREKELRDEFHTAEANHLKNYIEEVLDNVEYLGNQANLDSFIRYFYPKADNFLSLLESRKVLVVMDERHNLDIKADSVIKEFRDGMKGRVESGDALPGQAKLIEDIKKIYKRIEEMGALYLTTSDSRNNKANVAVSISMDVCGVSSYNSNIATLVKDLEKYRKQGYRILVTSSSKTRAKRLAKDIFDEYDIPIFYSDNMNRELQPKEIMTANVPIRSGFEYRGARFVVLTDSDIFGRKVKTSHRKRYSGDQISSLDELKYGDYVVHENYGIGIYRGIESITSEGVTKDYIKIDYAKDEKLYVVATDFKVVQKYGAAEGAKVKVNSLSRNEVWKNTKAKVQEGAQVVAKELVNLYAARLNKKGHVYAPDTAWQNEFEELFPYIETDDQLLAIKDTKTDLEEGKIMDRLVCGDVGFGKTEVALRASFKVVMEGKQVLYLVPTTILAKQHFDTFVERMKNFAVRVDYLSRFKSKKDQAETVRRFKEGNIDILIGTHRILSEDVKPKDLGLLIIDEEQRFGVKHKEKIKQLKTDVNVLTLTATPIPRTLHMSLIGVRDMSLLEEAPNDRHPIQTYVMAYNDEMVREAINRELARGGQVYYVHNRVNDIDLVTDKVKELLPDARVKFAHGQMKETELEDIMFEFINKEIDILVSTTIIETGLDIPNVNTMIIDDAERYGLSQLYQLRGRVGRSDRNAYAFLMYNPGRILKEEAAKRLDAIREFSDLGSGYKISMRDLEIRGAGTMFGTSQSGHIEAVGYDLYLKMLSNAILEARGEEVKEEFQTKVNIAVGANIPDSYISDEGTKLTMYNRIASIEGMKDYQSVSDELEDRFGEIPHEVAALLKVALIKAKAGRCKITEIENKGNKVIITFRNDAPIDTEKFVSYINSNRNIMRFIMAAEPYIECSVNLTKIPWKDEDELLGLCERVVDNVSHMLVEG